MTETGGAGVRIRRGRPSQLIVPLTSLVVKSGRLNCQAAEAQEAAGVFDFAYVAVAVVEEHAG